MSGKYMYYPLADLLQTTLGVKQMSGSESVFGTKAVDISPFDDVPLELNMFVTDSILRMSTTVYALIHVGGDCDMLVMTDTGATIIQVAIISRKDWRINGKPNPDYSYRTLLQSGAWSRSLMYERIIKDGVKDLFLFVSSNVDTSGSWVRVEDPEKFALDYLAIKEKTPSAKFKDVLQTMLVMQGAKDPNVVVCH